MPISDADFLQLQQQVEDIEAEMGLDPSGVYATLRTRLDTLSTSINSLANNLVVSISGDVNGFTSDAHVTKLQGFDVSSVIPLDNFVLTWNDTSSQWEPKVSSSFIAAGDLFGTSSTQKVIGLQGRTLSSTAPTDGQVLAWNNTFSAWMPTTTGSGTFSAGGDLSGSDSSQQVVGLRNRPMLATAPSAGEAIIWDGYAWGPGAVASGVTFAGDLSGSTSTQTVTGIRGFNILATTPTIDQVLTFDGTNWAPAPAPTSFTAGGDLVGSSSLQTVIAIRSRLVSTTPPQDGYALTYNAAIPVLEYKFIDHKTIIPVCSGMFSFSGVDFIVPVVIGQFEISYDDYPADAVVTLIYNSKKTGTMDSVLEIEEIETSTIFTGAGYYIDETYFFEKVTPVFPNTPGAYRTFEVRVSPDGIAGSGDGFIISNVYVKISY